METADSVASKSALCCISSSQQGHLRRCCFAGEPEDEPLSSDESGDIPVASTGIVIISPPESTEENENADNISNNDDISTALPEPSTLAAAQEQLQQAVDVGNHNDGTVEVGAKSEEIAVVGVNCTDDLITVDLGKDTDLGVAEVELTETIAVDPGTFSSPDVDQAQENKGICCGSMETRIMKRKLVSTDDIYTSLMITPETVDKNAGSSTPELHLCSETEKTLRRVEKTLKRVDKSVDKLKSWAKKSKILDEDLALKNLKDNLGAETKNLGKIVDSSGFEGFIPSSWIKPLQNHQTEEPDGGDREFRGTSPARKLDVNSGALESEFVGNNADIQISVQGENKEIEGDDANRLRNFSERLSGAKFSEKQKDNKAKTINNMDKFRCVGPMDAKRCSDAKFPEKQKSQSNEEGKSIYDIKKFRYAGRMGANSLEKKRDVRAQRALPKSLCENNGIVRGEQLSDNSMITILDVLKICPENYSYDPSVVNVSVIEALKRRGMTFP